MNYADMREKLYGPIRSVFSWDWLEGQEYGLAGIHSISPQFRQELAFATEELGKIFAKTVTAVQNGKEEDLLIELGIPAEALGAVRIPVFANMVTTIGRFDFAHTAEGPKLLEFNSDTPTSVAEAFLSIKKPVSFSRPVIPTPVWKKISKKLSNYRKSI